MATIKHFELDDTTATPEQMAEWNGYSKVDIHLMKREYFASMALMGILAGYPPDSGLDMAEDVKTAVQYADALLSNSKITRKSDRWRNRIRPANEPRRVLPRP